MSIASSAPMSPKDLPHITQFDGLRCVAILIVLVWHASLRAGRLADHVHTDASDISLYGYFPHGEIGVALFFFVSGFLVARPFLPQSCDRWSIGGYFLKRFVRIYPPYLVVLLLCYIALGIAGHRPADANSFAATDNIDLLPSFSASLIYLHTAIYNVPSRLNPPMWSLETEVGFYVTLPVFMLIYRQIRDRRIRLRTMAIAIIVSIVLASALVQPETDLRARWSMALHFYLFLCGIFAADLVENRSFDGAARHAYDSAFVIGLALLGGLGLVMTHNDAKMISPLYALSINTGLMAATALIFVGALSGKTTSKVLVFAPIRMVGIMCYSLYLTHIVVMTCMTQVLRRFMPVGHVSVIYLIVIGALLVGSLVVGAGFYVTVERPLTRWLSKRLWGGRLPRVEQAVVVAPDKTCVAPYPKILGGLAAADSR